MRTSAVRSVVLGLLCVLTTAADAQISGSGSSISRSNSETSQTSFKNNRHLLSAFISDEVSGKVLASAASGDSRLEISGVKLTSALRPLGFSTQARSVKIVEFSADRISAAASDSRAELLGHKVTLLQKREYEPLHGHHDPEKWLVYRTTDSPGNIYLAADVEREESALRDRPRVGDDRSSVRYLGWQGGRLSWQRDSGMLPYPVLLRPRPRT